jgi:hypothetical protein
MKKREKITTEGNQKFNARYLANICSKELILTQDWSSGCLGVQLELHTDDPNSISEKKWYLPQTYYSHRTPSVKRPYFEHIHLFQTMCSGGRERSV